FQRIYALLRFLAVCREVHGCAGRYGPDHGSLREVRAVEVVLLVVEGWRQPPVAPALVPQGGHRLLLRVQHLARAEAVTDPAQHQPVGPPGTRGPVAAEIPDHALTPGA